MFVVWEPVLPTDWGRPSPSLTGFVPDPRAKHFWDPQRKLSALLGGAPALGGLAGERKIGFHMNTVIWDAALVYPPGGRLGPGAKLLVAPVVKFRSDLGAAL